MVFRASVLGVAGQHKPMDPLLSSFLFTHLQIIGVAKGGRREALPWPLDTSILLVLVASFCGK